MPSCAFFFSSFSFFFSYEPKQMWDAVQKVRSLHFLTFLSFKCCVQFSSSFPEILCPGITSYLRFRRVSLYRLATTLVVKHGSLFSSRRMSAFQASFTTILPFSMSVVFLVSFLSLSYLYFWLPFLHLLCCLCLLFLSFPFYKGKC